MADPRIIFKRDVAVAVEDYRRASEALVAQLKTLTPEEFLRQPLPIFNRLTLEQYQKIVETIAPEMKIAAPDRQSFASAGRAERLRDFWRTRTATARSLYVTSVIAVVIALALPLLAPVLSWHLAPLLMERSVNPTDWPACSRLAPDVDGCVYTPTQPLDWNWIAHHAALDLTQLRRTNQHLKTDFVPAGAEVTIWRGRVKLKRSAR
jgi:hypothetical protein